MNNWVEASLDELGKVARGKSKHRPRNEPSLFGGIYPFVQTGDIKGSEYYVTRYSQTYNEKGLAQSKLWKKGTLCITIAANIADTAILGMDACFPDSIIGFIPNEKKCDVRFIKYHFDLIQKHLQSISQGTTQDNLSQSKLLKFKFNVPPLPEQQRIASILSAYDDLIEVNNQRIALLEQMAEQIYKEWFVRMRFPGYQHAEFEKGVPKGWLVELGNYINIVKGKSYTGEEINENGEGKPFLNLKSFNRGGGYRYDGIKFYTGKYHKKQLVKEGDIVMAVTDMTQDRAVVGRVARIPKTEFPEMVISLDSAKIELKKDLPKAFFYATLRFGFFGDTIKEFANGSNVLHLKPDLAYKMKSIIPTDDALMLKFDKIIEPYFNQIDNCHLQNQILKQTRDLLLPRLISGKLRVKDMPEPQNVGA